MSKSPSANIRPALQHWVFLGTLVALDFAFGLLAKTAMNATGISKVIHLEMVFPIALMLLGRLVVDRFGTLVAYEMAWAVLAVFAMPNAILPGPLKLIPAFFQGLVYDSMMSFFGRWPRFRLIAAATLGHLASTLVVMTSRIFVLGLPWSGLVKALLGWQILSSLAVSMIAAGFALLIWRRIRDLPLTRMLRFPS